MKSPARKHLYAGIVLGAVSLTCLLFSLGAITQPASAPSPEIAVSSASSPSSISNVEDATQDGTPGSEDSGTQTAPASQGDVLAQAPQVPESDASAPESDDVRANTIRISMVVDSSAATSLGFPATMASGTMELPTGTNAYDALTCTGLSLGGSSSYVSSINGLAEKMMGAASGWTYSVNGSTPMTAACNYTLKPGDSLCWRYVT